MANKSTIVRFVRGPASLLSAVAPSAAARWLARLFVTPTRMAQRPRERGWMEGATTIWLDLPGGGRVPMYCWGDCGPAVMLMHGWSGRASQLGHFVEPLRQRGFRVVAFDAPAHGEAPGGTAALPSFIAAAQRVAELTGPLHAVIAHSLGTAAASNAVRGGVHVDRLVYLAPPEDLATFLERMGLFLGFSRAVVRSARDLLESRVGLAFDVARGATIAPDMDTPLLIVHDRDDVEVPHTEGQRLAALWPGADLVLTDGLGHRRVVWAPAVVDRVLDYVSADVGLLGAA